MGRLTQLWRGNSRRAFEALVRPHLPALYRLAYRYVADPDDAQDLLQDLLLRLYEQRRELFAIERPRPWMMRVLHRLAIDRWRRVQARPIAVTGLEEAELENLLAANGAVSDSPEEAVARDARAESLLHALAQLSEEHRAIVILHDVEGYPLPELVEVLEVPIGTLKSRLHRARSRLKAILENGTLSSPDACNW